MAVKTGFVNGSDVLLYVGDKALGSCTSHKTTFDTETKEIKTKPDASVKTLTTGTYTKKIITKQSISISAEGLRRYDEKEVTFADLVKAWIGKTVQCKCMERDEAEKPYLAGNFIIAHLEEDAPAGEETKYSVQLENDGEPETLDSSVITPAPSEVA